MRLDIWESEGRLKKRGDEITNGSRNGHYVSRHVKNLKIKSNE
jgi:hypothetical protein